MTPDKRSLWTWLPFAILLPALAGGPPSSLEVTITPRVPRAGTFVLVKVQLSADAMVDGVSADLAGQQVILEQTAARTWEGLAGIPVDSTGEILLHVAGEARDTSVRVPLAMARFPNEKLRVDPRLTAPPDAALAARIQAEYRRAMRVSDEALATPRLWSGPFVRPRASRVTSPYGTGREFNGVVQSRHLGVDLAGAIGEPVRASNRGVVALVDRTYYGGSVVYVNHGGGIVTAYLHLSSTSVGGGDTVMAGSLLGRVGATGRVTGPHLHWIARYGTETLDPLSLVALDLASFAKKTP